MDNQNQSWRDRFSLTVCAAADVGTAIPADALGVAVVFTSGEAGEKVFLVIESRAGSLLQQCERRLKTAPLPPVETLQIAFSLEAALDGSPQAEHESCRRQVILAGALRRELRPALR